jgi:transcription antitermination protein NusB
MSGKSFSRRQSRRKAFELLFELEQHPGLTAEAILKRSFEQPDVIEVYSTDDDAEGYVSGILDAQSRRFVEELVSATKLNEQKLDTELAKYPHDWSYDRIGVPERVLLRLALAEMVYLGTSYKVVIDEALDMAKMYAQEDARRFINGILGAVMLHLDELKAAAREAQE